MKKPFSVFNIELTNHCIMKCIMCPRTRSMTRETGYMAFDLFKKAIDELSVTQGAAATDAPLWLHHFGESLMHPEFDRFIRYSAEKNIRTGLSINPLMLTDDISGRLLGSGISIIYVSLDGHDDESFSRIRGVKNSYTRSRERLISFLEKKITSGTELNVVLSRFSPKSTIESTTFSSVPEVIFFSRNEIRRSLDRV